MSRSLPPFRRYTPQEDDYIRKWLPTRGYTLVAKKLRRSAGGVWARAKRLGVTFGDIEGWTRTKALAAATHQSQSAVWNRAKSEGVLRQVGPKTGGQRSRAALVPNKWADAYLAEHQTLSAGEQLAEAAGWLTLGEVAAIWRIGKSTVNRAANGKGYLAPLIANIRKARAPSGNRKGQWLLEPYGVERVARELDRQRAQARAWISTKSLAIEAGVKQTYAADIGKREFGGELLFVHGRLMCFVPPEAAERMRWRFAEGVTPGKRLGRPKKQPELRRAA